MDFAVPDPTDAFKFLFGPIGHELVNAQLTSANNLTSLSLSSGTSSGALVADPGVGAIRLENDSGGPIQLGTSASAMTVSSKSDLLLGNTNDVARLSVGNGRPNFTVDDSGAITIGNGAPIARHLSYTAQLTFPPISAQSCQAPPLSTLGASDGDTVAIGVPDALASAGDLMFFAWVNQPDSVKMRACNMSNTDLSNPPVVTVRIDVWQHKTN